MKIPEYKNKTNVCTVPTTKCQYWFYVITIKDNPDPPEPPKPPPDPVCGNGILEQPEVNKYNNPPPDPPKSNESDPPNPLYHTKPTDLPKPSSNPLAPPEPPDPSKTADPTKAPDSPKPPDRGREGQAAMNPVENSPKPCRNSLRTLWKISEPCKEQKMC